jgi:putative sigma-54 modulation protein
MNVHVTGRQLAVTPAIREYVGSKLQRITHHFDHVIDVNVVMSVDKLDHQCEATVHVRGKDIFCESTAQDMYAAIDGLIDKLDRTILKHKEKNLAQRHGATPQPAAEDE